MTTLRWAIEHGQPAALLVGVVEARGCSVEDPAERLDPIVEDVLGALPVPWPPAELRAAVRDMMRGAGYKPSGRGKPASEYLAAAAQKGAFPRINNLVDINNLISVQSGLPASILDLDLALEDADALEVRYGAPDESYVFNMAGQSIALAGIVGVARAGGAMLANPVKDAMTAKTRETSRNAIAFVYAPRRAVSVAMLSATLERYTAWLRGYAGATSITCHVVQAPS